jgi:hypothetical protein
LREKTGQLAHLDRRNDNPSEDNLAFLCFVHHDKYDSTTSQSKNLTKVEVERYRDELYRDMPLMLELTDWSGLWRLALDHWGSKRAAAIAGDYTRVSGGTADIRVSPMLSRANSFHVDGFALWGEDRPFGPNMGDIQFAADLENNTLTFETQKLDGEIYRMALQFVGDGTLHIQEENWLGMYGMNVSFEGTYHRVGPLNAVLRAIRDRLRRRRLREPE